jgi:hypothetical protein
VRWEWLLVVNAPIAVIAMIGVRLGVPANRKEELTDDALDLPGTLLTISTMRSACYALTSGAEHGNGTLRGAAIAQIGTSIAMASLMFGLILHIQYAYGRSPCGPASPTCRSSCR